MRRHGVYDNVGSKDIWIHIIPAETVRIHIVFCTQHGVYCNIVSKHLRIRIIPAETVWIHVFLCTGTVFMVISYQNTYEFTSFGHKPYEFICFSVHMHSVYYNIVTKHRWIHIIPAETMRIHVVVCAHARCLWWYHMKTHKNSHNSGRNRMN